MNKLIITAAVLLLFAPTAYTMKRSRALSNSKYTKIRQDMKINKAVDELKKYNMSCMTLSTLCKMSLEFASTNMACVFYKALEDKCKATGSSVANFVEKELYE